VPDGYVQTEERRHGRHEVRKAWVIDDISACPQASKWPGAKSLIMVERTRTTGDVVEEETHVYISSRLGMTAKTALHLIRSHWSVENGLHWVLDVAFREDRSRIHSENGAQNFALLRRIALNALKRDTQLKHGIRVKQKNCGWDHEYLLSILQLMVPEDEPGTMA
jgi:predicted transposase YbfD/YdcC